MEINKYINELLINNLIGKTIYFMYANEIYCSTIKEINDYSVTLNGYKNKKMVLERSSATGIPIGEFFFNLEDLIIYLRNNIKVCSKK